jgi:signal transduction histidine kinase
MDVKDLTDLVEQEELPEKLRASLLAILRESVPLSIDFIARSVAKMDQLLSGLLRISRLGRAALAIEALDMNRLVRDAAATHGFRLKEKGMTLHLEPLSDCMGDAVQISQVFDNLIGNAVKFTDPAREGRIVVSGRRDGDRVVYRVEDNGIGIPAEHQGKIFEVFHQLDPESEGQGLGLSIVGKIMERHDGKVWVESEPGRFCRFFVSLAGVSGEKAQSPRG